MLRSILLSLVLLFPAPLRAAEPFVVQNATTERVRSRNTEAEYNVYVRLPAGYDATRSEPYPVIYLLDGDYAFAIASGIVRKLSSRGQGPEAIVVGVSYPGAATDEEIYRATRTRDYTPSYSPDGGYGPSYQSGSGGGPRFLAFLRDELIPRVEGRLNADSGKRAFVGHSYGGLFGAWVLMREPDLFSHFFLVSPSLWYEDGRYLREALAAEVRPRRPTKVFLAVGALERSMVDELERFDLALKREGNANLTVERRVFEDETHASVFPAAFSAAYRKFFQ